MLQHCIYVLTLSLEIVTSFEPDLLVLRAMKARTMPEWLHNPGQSCADLTSS